jgi:hypothetical protein
MDVINTFDSRSSFASWIRCDAATDQGFQWHDHLPHQGRFARGKNIFGKCQDIHVRREFGSSGEPLRTPV